MAILLHGSHLGLLFLLTFFVGPLPFLVESAVKEYQFDVGILLSFIMNMR